MNSEENTNISKCSSINPDAEMTIEQFISAVKSDTLHETIGVKPSIMQKVTCADCGSITERFYRPDKQPKYCLDCWRKHPIKDILAE